MKNPSNIQELQAQIAQMESNIRRFEGLNRMFAAIWSLDRVEDVISRIIEETLTLTAADQGTIFLFDPAHRQEAKTLVRKSENQSEILDRYLNNLLSGWVSKHRKILLSNHLSEIFGRENISEKYQNIQSALSVPLMPGETIIGVINLISCDPEHHFTKADVQMMEMLAFHCARFIQNAHLREKMFAETTRLKLALQEKYDFQGLIGQSRKMKEVFALLERIIPTDVRVLIEGETGTGKELVARILHFNGPQKDAPFVPVDCGALPANLLESELFGYEKGAFTGADRDRKGLFEAANGGTLFLDEIGNLPQEVQVKLLRAIQEGEIRPLGSNKTVKVAVRLMAATSKNLKDAIKDGTFRQDLFFRLNVMNIKLPPLRERREDISILAQHFLKIVNEKYNKEIEGFTPDCLRHLENLTWPGNIRELENAVERAVILCQGKFLTVRDFPTLPPDLSDVNDALFQPRPLQTALGDFKKQFIENVLQHAGNNQSKAAQILQIQRTYLNRLIKVLKIR